jgi:hypothetical protein
MKRSSFCQGSHRVPSRSAPVVMAIAVLGLLAWLFLGRGDGPSTDPSGDLWSEPWSEPPPGAERPPGSPVAGSPRAGPDPGFVGEGRYGDIDVRSRLGLSAPGTRFPLPRPSVTLPDPDPGGGSRMPCMLPLSWRVARVDAGFALDSVSAAVLVAEAVALWEAAAGRPLFREDPREGLPIRFMLRESESAGAVEEFRRVEGEYERGGEELRRRLGEFEARLTGEEERRRSHQEQVVAFEERVALHNREVEGWRERGGAPPEVVPLLQATERALETERGALLEERSMLEALRDTLAGAEEGLRGEAEAHRARGEELRRQFPPVREEAGLYREAFQTGADGTPRVSREIRVQRPADRTDLVRILAHELGHALGLPHLDVEGALMAAEYDRTTSRTPPRIHPADLARLMELCSLP